MIVQVFLHTYTNLDYLITIGMLLLQRRELMPVLEFQLFQILQLQLLFVVLSLDIGTIQVSTIEMPIQSEFRLYIDAPIFKYLYPL